MTPDELRPILTAYRGMVQPAWSKATAHPSFEGADGSPVGQCGVTSAWLMERLREDHGITTLFCAGSVVPIHYRTPPVDHCWLELGTGPDRIVIDLTADQLCEDADYIGTAWDFMVSSRHYVAYRRTGSVLAADPVTERLALLEGALA